MCIVFIDIMAWPVSDILPTCVFNNIMGLTFIFPPRIFLASSHPYSAKRLNIKDLHFWALPGKFL